MADRLPLPGPDKGECGGNRDRCTGDMCPVFGTLLPASRDGQRRVRGCDDPVARGKRNRAKGDSKARRARKALGLAGANTRHEEHFGGMLRVEFKAGKQVESLCARFAAAEAQSNAAKSVGDSRPFVFGAMPDGSSDGVVAMRLSAWEQFVRPALEEFYRGNGDAA